MAKFEPVEGDISDIEIRLECLRLATEFAPEYQRKDPLPVADQYFEWVTKVSKRQSVKTSKKKV